MKLVIDTNLLFSAISKRDGIIAELIMNPQIQLHLTGCYFSYIELFKYKEKLIKTSNIVEIDFLHIMYQIIKRIHFVNESIIPKEIIYAAHELTHDIDEKDTVFVAMSLFTQQALWSGDKELVMGLR